VSCRLGATAQPPLPARYGLVWQAVHTAAAPVTSVVQKLEVQGSQSSSHNPEKRLHTLRFQKCKASTGCRIPSFP
jgi:hypothetical protein